MNDEYVILVWKNMRSRKLRSFLTLIGIVIGVASIILLYTAGQGLENVAGREFEKFGTNKLLVGPKQFSLLSGGPQGTQGLRIEDAHVIESISDVELVTYAFRQNGELKKDKKSYLATIGAASTDNVEENFADSGLFALEGRLLRNGDTQKIAVLGYGIAKSAFDEEIYPGQKILIENIEFRVVGVMKKTGGQQDDYSVWIPYEPAKEVFKINDEVTGISVKIKDGIDLDSAAKKIERTLEKKRGQEDFVVINPVQLQQQSKDVLGVVKLVIVAIGLISLFVGGIGIMNSMYTAVLERTKEIGTMKAVGAKNSDILKIFLIESALMGFLGGLIAALVAALGIFGMQKFFDSLSVVPIEITYDPLVFGMAISFAIITGIGAGLWPAYKAAQLKPVDALRYE